MTARSCEAEPFRKAARHAQVAVTTREPTLEADDEVLAAPLDRRDALSRQLRLDLGRGSSGIVSR